MPPRDRKKSWPSAEEVCEYIDRWTRSYRLALPGLVVVDHAPEAIREPRWAVSEIFPSCGKIFQEREEFLEFLRVIRAHDIHGVAIEVGLDQGGTHMGWRRLFRQVATVEIDVNKCVKFLASVRPGPGSRVFCADSCDRDTRTALRKFYPSVDLLFIDGDHQYSSVLCDYDCLAPLVRRGGMIGFHDSVGRHPSHLGVVKFLRKLAAGEFDGRKHKLATIERGGTGITYEVVQ